MNELLKTTQATSKEVAFFRNSGEKTAMFYRRVNLPKGSKLIDFVLEAWKGAGCKAPHGDPLQSFKFRSHDPCKRRPAGYLSVYVINRYLNLKPSKPALPAQL